MNTKIDVDQVYRVFDDPPVYITSGARGMDLVVQHGVKGATCLIIPIWLFGPKSLAIYLPRLRALREKGIAVIVTGNTLQETYFLRLCGIRSIFANQNQFSLEDNVPVRPPHTSLDYDAFYAAQAQPFKRMHLASDIKRLYILTYRWPKQFQASKSLAEFEPRVAHADYNKRYLGFGDIVRIMHRSACALALSRKEGAMWAVCEALLAGLPVVSTRSKGGRTRYFDSQTVTIVQAHSRAVAAAVERWQDPPDPQAVRRITLDKIMADRRKLIDYFGDTLLKGYAYSETDIYSRLFRDGQTRTPLVFNQE